MQTILGAGGAIGRELFPLILESGETVRLVSRNPAAVPNAENRGADLDDEQQTRDAVNGSRLVYLIAGIAYSANVWRNAWPKIMANVIAACERAGARLVFFDNCYAYGAVDGPMTEETPFRPTSEKGKVRAQIAERLLAAVAQEKIEALIARSADFYGPSAKANGIPNQLVFKNLSIGKPAQCLVTAELPHSYTYVPDAARALVALAARDGAFGQTWHVPTRAPAISGREFIHLAADALGKPNRFTVLRPWMIGAFGLIDRKVGELAEMLYQNDRPYLFDSSKFERAFGIAPTPYPEGIAATARAYTPEASLED